MPSLRRTASSPSVRSSPYHSSSSSNVARRGHGHRRSSGSETSSRRVLADIEWWRVTDGQCDPATDNESEDRNRVISDWQGAVSEFISTDAGVGYPSASLPWISELVPSSLETLITLPTEEFATLSIAPRTPTSRHHSKGSSSLESTPGTSVFVLDDVHPGVSDVETGFNQGAIPTVHIPKRNRVATAPSSLLRSHTFSDCLSLHKTKPSMIYADYAISPLSSAPNFFN